MGGSYREDTELATNTPLRSGGTDGASLVRLLSDLACRLTPALLVFFLLASPVVFLGGASQAPLSSGGVTRLAARGAPVLRRVIFPSSMLLS